MNPAKSGTGSRGASAELYLRSARDLFDFVDHFPDMVRDGPRTLAERAERLLSAFRVKISLEGAPDPAVRPAAYSLAVLVDQTARAQRGLPISAWIAAAQTRLFDGRDISVDDIRHYADTAKTAGKDYTGLAEFLQSMLQRLEGKRRIRTGPLRRPAVWIGAYVVLLAVTLVGYAAYLDYRFHSDSLSAFEEEVARLPAADDIASLSDRLTRLAGSVARVSKTAASAPLAGVINLPFNDSADMAASAYRAEVNKYLPDVIASAIDETLATEGDSIVLYDALRVWSIMAGQTEWSPAYVVGWLDDRAGALELGELARHANVLAGPEAAFPNPDPDLEHQARVFAAETSEAERAWLELQRSEAVAELPDWQPDDAVRGIETIFVRRSGAPLGAGMSGLYTIDGWNHARAIGVGTAVQRARTVAPGLLQTATAQDNSAPDVLLNILQAETLAHWKAWLSDLRVRPFSDRTSALSISGALAQRSSPLDPLFRQVWEQVGGLDRQRPHNMQLRIATVFGPTIQYVEQGRLDHISALFASLNVALGALDVDDQDGPDRLMSVQETSRTVAALKAAPELVVQITEDVLAQSGAGNSAMGNPLTQRWQQEVYPLCRQVIDGRYPFGEGQEVGLNDFSEFLGPQGALPRFFATHADRNIEKAGDRWRWNPEARLSGLNPETAEFFQLISAISNAFFGASGRLGTDVKLVALAERGQATVIIGGAAVPVRASGDAATINWPGQSPDAGAEVTFRQGDQVARLVGEGAWGMFRVLDQARLRIRDEGRRMLVDLRSDGGRLFFEMEFPAPNNPVSVRTLMKGLTCPPVL